MLKRCERIYVNILSLLDQSDPPELSFLVMILFCLQACLIAPRHIEALLLKGQNLLELKKHPEAVMHFRGAQQICSHRYEPHKGLVDCFVAMHRFREALTIACSAVKQLGQTPRSLTVSFLICRLSLLMYRPIYVASCGVIALFF